MGFISNKSNTNTASGNGIPANKKAVGFINLYLPTKGGGRRKLGQGIPLRAAFENEATLANWLAEDPIARCKLILAGLQIEYNSATPEESSGFALPDDAGDEIPGA